MLDAVAFARINKVYRLMTRDKEGHAKDFDTTITWIRLCAQIRDTFVRLRDNATEHVSHTADEDNATERVPGRVYRTAEEDIATERDSGAVELRGHEVAQCYKRLGRHILDFLAIYNTGPNRYPSADSDQVAALNREPGLTAAWQAMLRAAGDW